MTSIPVPRWLAILLTISILFLNAYFVFVPHSFVFFYYIFFVGIFGGFYMHYRERITLALQGLPFKDFFLFLVLGLGMVLFEETIVAFVHSFTEGFTPPVFFLRLEQFWAFNFLAFIGFVVGWYIAAKRYRYSTRDIFLISGAWGLYAEHTLVYLVASPIVAVLLILPVMSAYYLISAPALSTLEGKGRETNVFVRYAFALVLMFVISLPPIVALSAFRAHAPQLFPPCNYIPC